jgi:bifunctional N-acetylglucosamine-1-phosphate-uridyltransferase/glucosamine-1-phosphate-acetyltransferase GlmU-like protein
MSVVAIIPARYGSTRLPGKPLAMIGGKPMIQHVCESTAKARVLDRIIVATDDRRIEAAVKSFGGEVMITSPRQATGSFGGGGPAAKVRLGRKRPGRSAVHSGDDDFTGGRAAKAQPNNRHGHGVHGDLQ